MLTKILLQITFAELYNIVNPDKNYTIVIDLMPSLIKKTLKVFTGAPID